MFTEWRFSLYLVPSLLSGLITFILAIIAAKRREIPGATPLTFMMLFSSLWAFSYSMALGSTTLWRTVFWFNTAQIGSVFIPLLHLFLAIEYSRRESLSLNRGIILLLSLPVLILVVMFTNESHHLMRRSLRLVESGPVSYLMIERGPFFWIEIAFSYLLLTIAFVLLIRTLRRETFKRNTALLLTSFSLPILSNILDLFGMNPLRIFGSTNVVFSLSGLLLAIGLFYLGLFQLSPIAHEKIIAGMRLGIIVVDREGRIVECNPAGLKLIESLGLRGSSLYGESIKSLFSSWETWIRGLGTTSSKPFVVTGKDSIWETVISPIYRRNYLLGYTITLYDITKRIEYEKKVREYSRELEVKNDKLLHLYRQVDQEIQKAVRVHRQTLQERLPEFKELTFSAYYQPAISMGGDSYFVARKGNKAIFYLSDVTGHGLDSAMLTIFLKEAIDSFINLQREELEVESILRHLDRQFRRENFVDDYAICIFLFIVDIERMEMSYSGAGFNDPPLLKRGEEELELVNSGLPISNAIPSRLLDFQEKRISLSKGATLLVNTDGITEQSVEAREGVKEIYGERLREVFFKEASSSAQGILEAIKEDFKSFNHQSKEGDDDITLLVMKVVGEE